MYQIINTNVRVVKLATAIIILLAILFLTRAYFMMQTVKKIQVRLGGVKITAEVARTESQQEKGLSGRLSLGTNEGLLFVFKKPDHYGFWMKDMNFPIDIIWIGKDLKIVDVSRDVSPSTFPKTFLPKEPALFVLEVNSGWAEQNKVAVGDSVDYTL